MSGNAQKQPLLIERARAKINLTLHVGAALESGLHPLHSLVVFADVGDELSARTAKETSLQISGPYGHGLSCGADNLILKAAQGSAAALAFKLTKNLPISSGIGGGSADAAAALRLLARVNGTAVSMERAAEIGADVPVCTGSATCLMEGTGAHITPMPALGQLAAVLVNPNIPVSTAAIFLRFDHGASSSESTLAGDTLLDMARAGRNDLQDIAIEFAPVIADALAVIAGQKGCDLSRMSGSGATCFGLFASAEAARCAAEKIRNLHPKWWCVQATLGDM